MISLRSDIASAHAVRRARSPARGADDLGFEENGRPTRPSRFNVKLCRFSLAARRAFAPRDHRLPRIARGSGFGNRAPMLHVVASSLHSAVDIDMTTFLHASVRPLAFAALLVLAATFPRSASAQSFTATPAFMALWLQGVVPYDRRSADFDGDGLSDTILRWFNAGSGQSEVGILYNPASVAGFLAAPPIPVFAIAAAFPGTTSSSIHEVGDFDGNGTTDVLYMVRTPAGVAGAPVLQDRLYVVPNLGAGVFGPPYLHSIAAQPTSPPSPSSTSLISSTVLDFNGDGMLDVMHRVLAPNVLRYDVHVTGMPGAGATRVSFPGPAGWTVNNATGPFPGDFNGDGYDDFVVVRHATGLAQIALGGGGPAFTPMQPFTIPTPYTAGTGVEAWGDVDGDGFDDLVIVNLVTSTNHYVCWGDANAAFAASTPLPTPTNGVPSPFYSERFVQIHDLDLDGRKDLLMLASAQPNGTPSHAVMVRNGGGRTFGAGTYIGSTPSNLSYPGDLDGDGDVDFLPFMSLSSAYMAFNQAVYGDGCAGVFGVPVASVGTASVGNPAFHFGLSAALPGTTAICIVSLAPLALLPGSCGLLVDTAPGALVLPSGAQGIMGVDGSGRAALVAPIPNLPALRGYKIFQQWAVLDAASTFTAGGSPFALSRGRTIVID
jgi:hypothetical protein